jgi:D-glycero-D-manno-heptose 1,7-bisphosphate phosphatase
MSRPAIFLDRDGTVSREVGYVNHPDRLELYPRSAEAVRRINQSGRLAVLVTNQAGAARGYFPFELIETVHERLQALLAGGGARLDALYYCPHHPEVGEGDLRRDCECRKPGPGMLLRAREELGADLSRSWIVGDSFKDMEAGLAAGVPGVLLRTGYGRGELLYKGPDSPARPSHVADDLLDAVRWILEREEERG